jgi:Flp pilus assembly protein TadD
VATQTNVQTLEDRIVPLLEKWSRGEVTLKEIKGYSEEELFAIANQGYFFFLQGKTEPARVIFEGLVAIDPKNAYYYRALGVIYFRLKELEKAVRQFTYSIRVAPREMSSYINRAEIYMAQKDFGKARDDLARAQNLAGPEDTALIDKVNAMLVMIPGGR